MDWENILIHILDTRTYGSINRGMRTQIIQQVVRHPVTESELIDAINTHRIVCWFTMLHSKQEITVSVLDTSEKGRTVVDLDVENVITYDKGYVFDTLPWDTALKYGGSLVNWNIDPVAKYYILVDRISFLKDVDIELYNYIGDMLWEDARNETKSLDDEYDHDVVVEYMLRVYDEETMSDLLN